MVSHFTTSCLLFVPTYMTVMMTIFSFTVMPVLFVFYQISLIPLSAKKTPREKVKNTALK